MKANELEIGDLVDVRGSFARVSELSDTGFFRARELEYNSTLHLSSDVIDASTNPIPLTEEILKANGFEVEKYNFVDRKGYRKVVDNTTILLSLDYSTSKNLVSVIDGEGVRAEGRWKYVHELQHALRLCWLYYLADNFKLNDK